jgi:glycosyltransferase involved in cell wall biosynthesis
MPAVTVIVPTLNEAGNIEPLVSRLATAFGPRGEWEVLFVDDDSKDGTAAEIQGLAGRCPVRLIVRKGERGLGSAVLRGMASTEAPTVVVMDADLSHPPEAAPKLADAVAGGADVAIGSRYVPGGGTEGWSRVRLFLSRGAALLARGLTSARDPGAGFFAMRRSLLDGAALKVEGFKILLEILAKLRPARVVEVPISFAPRHAGKSKVAAGTAIAYLRQLARLYAARPAAQVVAFIAFLFALKVVVGSLTELDSIEAYHWLYAQHPALGYYDHPGMIGWMIWLSTAIFGDSPLGVRLVPFLASSLAIWLVFLAGRRLYDEGAGRLAALLFGIAFGTLKFGSMATPDGPLLLFWVATIWAMAHALAGGRISWWLASGAFLGGAMLSKYTAIFLPVGVLLFMIFSREHAVWFRRKEPYFAALVALAVFSPTIIWNAQNEWQSFVYQGVGRVTDVRGFTTKYARQMAALQLWLLTPVAALWAWGSGFASLARWRSRSWPDRFVASIAMPILLFFMAVSLIRSVRGHWMLVGGATLFLLSAAVVTRGGRLGRWLHYGTIWLCLVGAAAAVAVVAAQDPEKLHGWSKLARHVEAMKADFSVAQDYHIAAHLAHHLRPRPAVDFTSVGSGGKSFSNWWQGSDHAGRDAVIVWEKGAYPEGISNVRACFAELGPAVEVSVPRFGADPETFVLVRARSYRPPGNVKRPPPSDPP